MQERAVATRQKILRAAAEVFASRGYAGASMSDLLAGTGVTKGGLYFHFPSKEDLARAIFAEDQRFSATNAPKSDRPLQSLIDMSHSFAASLQEDPLARASVRLAIEMAFNGDAVPPGFDTWATSVTQLLVQAGECGELASGINPAQVAEVITASFTGLQLVSEAASHRRDLQDRVTQWWQLLLVGLATPDVLPLLDPRGTQQAPVHR